MCSVLQNCANANSFQDLLTEFGADLRSATTCGSYLGLVARNETHGLVSALQSQMREDQFGSFEAGRRQFELGIFSMHSRQYTACTRVHFTKVKFGRM